MVNKRIYDLSCNEEEFNKAKPFYKNVLKESGYTTSLKYTIPYENNNKNSNRKILWFNPPFNQNVKTNICKIFIKLIKKRFPKDNKIYKIFDTNTTKLSYNCIPNMSRVIKQHNLHKQKYFHHHKPTKYVNITGEIQPAVHSTVNVLLETLFIKQFYQQPLILIHITAVVKISSFGTTNIQNHLATNIVKTIQNFLDLCGILEKGIHYDIPGVFLLMPQNKDMVQEDVMSVSQKSPS